MTAPLYLDHAATSPVRGEVLEAMAPFLTRDFGNPSSHHTVGESAAAALEDARARVARVLGMRTGDIVFTAGGTEANNLAVKGIVLAALAGAARPGAATVDGRPSETGHARTHIITTPIEHESILESVHYLERFHGVVSTFIDVDGAGRVGPAAVASSRARSSPAATRWSRHCGPRCR